MLSVGGWIATAALLAALVLSHLAMVADGSWKTVQVELCVHLAHFVTHQNDSVACGP